MLVGVMVMDELVELLFQIKLFIGRTERVVLSPWQMDDIPEIETVGNGFTVTICVAVLMQAKLFSAVTE